MSTITTIEVTIVATAKCDGCGKQLRTTEDLPEESLTTGSTTQHAGYWATAMRARIDKQKKRALWDDNTCGQCRVNKAEKLDDDERVPE